MLIVLVLFRMTGTNSKIYIRMWSITANENISHKTTPNDHTFDLVDKTRSRIDSKFTVHFNDKKEILKFKIDIVSIFNIYFTVVHGFHKFEIIMFIIIKSLADKIFLAAKSPWKISLLLLFKHSKWPSSIKSYVCNGLIFIRFRNFRASSARYSGTTPSATKRPAKPNV